VAWRVGSDSIRVRFGLLGMDWLALVRHDSARHGVSRQGVVWIPSKNLSGSARYGRARHGLAWLA
jgi:hypothetical protein